MASSSRLALLGVAVLATAARADRLVVAPDATVAAEVVTLADVATLEGPAAEALAGVGLGPAPAAGESRTLDGGMVLATLRRAGLDPAVVTYTVPPMVRVRRASQEISEGAVRGILQTYLADALGDGLVDATIRSVQLPGVIRIPTGAFEAHVSAPPGSELVGRVRLAITFTVGERSTRETWVTADIARFGRVAVARRALGRGQAVTADDVDVDRRDLSELPRGILTAAADVVGMLTTMPMLPHAPFTRDALAAPKMVKRGDVVLLVVQRGGLRITAPGEVREDAARGAAVRVVNRASHQEVIGHVQDPGTVVVDF